MSIDVKIVYNKQEVAEHSISFLELLLFRLGIGNGSLTWLQYKAFILKYMPKEPPK